MSHQEIKGAMTAKDPAVQAKIEEIYKSLPRVVAPTRETTCVLLPLGDYRLDYETHNGLLASAAMYSAHLATCGHSDVGRAREVLFNTALRSPFDWLVCIDSDIGFTAEDFAQLLTLENDQDYAVQGPYAKKQPTEEAVTMGLGFTRIHRCVLEAIATHYSLRYDDEQARDYQQFCLQGVNGNRGMMREDVGFWFMCGLVGVKPRIDPKICVRHYGGRYEHTLSEFTRMHL